MSGLIELLPSPEIDENLLAAERLENLRGTMLADGLQLLVLTNPVSIRYATGYRAYSAFQSRIPSAYAIVPLVGPIIMLTKMMLLVGIIMWVRFSYPRFREDQLQRFAWKVLIPVSLLNIAVTAILKVAV